MSVLKKGKEKTNNSQISKLLEVQEQLRHELTGLSKIIQQKEVEIAKLKDGIGKTFAEPGPSSEMTALYAFLKEENAKLMAQVNELKDKLIKSHESSVASMAFLIQNLTPKP